MNISRGQVALRKIFAWPARKLSQLHGGSAVGVWPFYLYKTAKFTVKDCESVLIEGVMES